MAKSAPLLRGWGGKTALAGSNPAPSSNIDNNGEHIMDQSAFATWKFRNIEGLLKYMNRFKLDVTRYVNPDNGRTAWIKYDSASETATIETDCKTRTCKFSEISDLLKELGLYEERQEGDRHSAERKNT